MAESADPTNMIECVLGRIVIRDGADRQYIYLSETDGQRGFPIVIGNSEAGEIHRVIHNIEPDRPLTHQLTFNTIELLGATIRTIDIVDLRQNTFYAQIVPTNAEGNVVGSLDARPSDAIALALRAGSRIRVAEAVLEEASRGDGTV